MFKEIYRFTMNEELEPKNNKITIKTKVKGDKFVVYFDHFPMGTFDTHEKADEYILNILTEMKMAVDNENKRNGW